MNTQQDLTLSQIQDARREQMLHELASDMADLVRTGDMTPEEANQWVADKADQWK